MMEESKFLTYKGKRINIGGLSFRLLPPLFSGGVFEGFEGYGQPNQVPGWSGGFRVYVTQGYNSDNRYASGRIYSLSSAPRNWVSPEVSAGNNPIIQFQYRVVNHSSYPANATAATAFTIQVQVKLADADDSTYETLETIGSGNHTVSNAYALKTITLPVAYKNKNIIIRTIATRISGDFWVDFDNIRIGTFGQIGFTILDRKNDPVNGASISITGPVSNIIITGADGKAMELLPSGDYTYTISVTNYLTYTGGSFSVSRYNVNVSTPALIGNFVLTLQTRDQDNNPLGNVNINLSGFGYTYTGTDPISGNIQTNASGIVALALKDGEYNYVATKTGYTTTSGSLTMLGATKLENVILQLI